MFQTIVARAGRVLVAAALAAAVPAFSASAPAASAGAKFHYVFQTLNDAKDPTFNQLLGIDHTGKIVGYYGSGTAGHPNNAYLLLPPHGQNDYVAENFPGAAQTQAVALNNRHDLAGFYVDGAGNNFGFIKWDGQFTSYRDPKTGSGTVNQILGLNDSGIAVGFYTDGAGLNHAFALNRKGPQFVELTPPGGNNATASGINDQGDVTGYLTSASGAVVSFLYRNGKYYEFSFPNATSTTAYGINRSDEIAGSYIDAGGATHGFTLSDPLGKPSFATIDDPRGVGTTVVNGINTTGELVGFYVDAAGNTDGFLAILKR